MLTFERHIAITNPKLSIIELLSQHCELSNSELKQAIDKGALWLTRNKATQRLRRLKKPLQIGDQLHFYYNEKVLAERPNKALLLADYQDYSIWYKPFAMLSQGSKWSDHCTIERWVQKHLAPQRPVFIVHRLDKAATGIMVIAHSKQAARLLAAMFEHHQLEKYYQIICHGDHSSHQQPEVFSQEVDGKSARSIFTCIDYDSQADLSLIKVKIDSGRKHQIRKHAASLGLPVVGDRLHGNKTQNYSEQLNLQLCSVELSFSCPISGELRHICLPKKLTPSISAVKALLQA